MTVIFVEYLYEIVREFSNVWLIFFNLLLIRQEDNLKMLKLKILHVGLSII